MPGNGPFLVRVGCFAADKPSSCKKNIVQKTTAGNGELTVMGNTFLPLLPGRGGAFQPLFGVARKLIL
jgi:hypothetical protein